MNKLSIIIDYNILQLIMTDFKERDYNRLIID